MTTEQYLLAKGVTMEVAKTFIFNNLNNLQYIINVCKEFNVNNDMIADIVGLTGFNGKDVTNYFKMHGLDSEILGYSEDTENYSIKYGQNLDIDANQLLNITNGFRMSTLQIEYSEPGYLESTIFDTRHTNYLNIEINNNFYVDYQFNWEYWMNYANDYWSSHSKYPSLLDMSNDASKWDMNIESIKQSDLNSFQIKAINKNTLQEDYDTIELISIKEVKSILGIAVDAIEVKSKNYYNSVSGYNSVEWEESGYNSQYSSIEDFSQQLTNLGIGFGNEFKLTTDHKIISVPNDKIIDDAYWVIENDILKLNYWDEVWFKLDQNHNVLVNYIADTTLEYVGVDDTQAQAIISIMGLPEFA